MERGEESATEDFSAVFGRWLDSYPLQLLAAKYCVQGNDSWSWDEGS